MTEEQPMNRRRDDASTDDLQDAVVEVVAGFKGLQEQLTVDEYVKRRNFVWIVCGVAAVVIFSIIQVIAAYEARQGREQLIDCTQVGGECYEQSQERTARLVTQIVCINNENTRTLLLSVLPDANLPDLPVYCSEGA